MDFEAMRAGLAHAIPYNTHLGLETVELSPERGVARLPQDDRLVNHVGSQHAGGLLAELEREGRVRFPVQVDLTNEAGDTVAEVTVRWYVRKNS
jgi:acyl-coenzyme A thioesterase PaaI-like protein